MNRLRPFAGLFLLTFAFVAQDQAAESGLTPAQRKELGKKAADLDNQMVQQFQRGDYAAATKLAQQALAMRQALYLNVGFAHRPQRMKTGIRLSKMIVTSSHSESGCHEDSM